MLLVLGQLERQQLAVPRDELAGFAERRRDRVFASVARDGERELQVKAIIDGELPIEPELERWFPLWEIPL